MRIGFHRKSVSSIALFVLMASSACNSGDIADPVAPPASVPATETYAASLGVNIASMTKVNDNLYTQDLTVGNGVVVLNNHQLTVTYTGYLVNGTVFDSQTGSAFILGTGAVIPGWDQGLQGMRAGGKRLLVIGSTLGYGAASNGSIPASSTLVFTVQVTAVQ